MKAAGQDENGMDLSFTIGRLELKNKKTGSDFWRAMENSAVQPKDNMHTDMQKSLDRILSAQLEEIKRNWFKGSPKKLTIIVLTDGVWAGMKNKRDVDKTIVKFGKDVQNFLGNSEPRSVSIEFIQFGYNVDATHRLRRLDDELKFEGIP